MIRGLNNEAGQDVGNNLTPGQRQLLNHFGAMDDEAQYALICMAESIARGSPRVRPTLRLIVGGAA
jgi:hypothetical protein